MNNAEWKVIHYPFGVARALHYSLIPPKVGYFSVWRIVTAEAVGATGIFNTSFINVSVA